MVATAIPKCDLNIDFSTPNISLAALRAWPLTSKKKHPFFILPSSLQWRWRQWLRRRRRWWWRSKSEDLLRHYPASQQYPNGQNQACIERTYMEGRRWQWVVVGSLSQTGRTWNGTWKRMPPTLTHRTSSPTASPGKTTLNGTAYPLYIAQWVYSLILNMFEAV